jgi:hypothetical protein
MSTIFGNGKPKFTGTGTPDSTARTFYYPILTEMNFSEKITKMNESIISHKRTWDHKGRHGLFVVKELLYKLTTSPTPKEWLTTLLTYEHQDVKFYISSDATAPCLKNTAGTDITCHIVNIEPGFEDNRGLLLDYCLITFMTNEPYDLDRLILP